MAYDLTDLLVLICVCLWLISVSGVSWLITEALRRL